MTALRTDYWFWSSDTISFEQTKEFTPGHDQLTHGRRKGGGLIEKLEAAVGSISAKDFIPSDFGPRTPSILLPNGRFVASVKANSHKTLL